MQTIGVSPKATAAFVIPIVLGMLVAIADKLLLGDTIPDALWLGFIGAGPIAGGSAFAAKPGVIVGKQHEERDLHDAPGV